MLPLLIIQASLQEESQGSATFYFVDAVSSCISDTSLVFSVNDAPIAGISGVDSFAFGESTALYFL